MHINVYRGKIEGWVSYEVDCFIRKLGSKLTCAYIKHGSGGHFYTLVGSNAHSFGGCTKLLKERIASGDAFTYRKKSYIKLPFEEEQVYDGKEYRHIMGIGPSCLQYIIF